jgi:lipopolysaccharide/colanic/teichoic acid biosynthesis glycosyltransferase
MIVKRIFDFSSALVGLILLCPVYVVIALLIRIKMPGGPVLFSQKRVGRYGGLFVMHKFRTMAVNHGGSSISVKGESRITPLGAVLRKYKLDELPELWNILTGDMSLVGPRPDVPGYADKLTGDDRLLLTIRPGLTGPASMKYSDEEEILALQPDPRKYNDEVLYPDKVRINLEYIRHWAFWLDIRIILLTLLGRKLEEPWV